AAVDERVRHLMDTWNIVAFWGDPSHAKDDDSTSFWDNTIDGWHQDYGSRMRIWATEQGAQRHSILWDMASPKRTEQFTHAAERFEADMTTSGKLAEAGDLDGRTVTHDNHPALRAHLKNAKRYPNRYGVSVWKGHRESVRKIDLAVCAIGARMLRRVVLNSAASKKKSGKRAGKAW
ncbi:MAG: hypothetical protein R2754_00005, partial [Microthrixaceae bacterium]